MSKLAKDKINKKCKSCSLDCVVTRAVLVANIEDSKKREDIIKKTFEAEKPKYNRENCPKK